MTHYKSVHYCNIPAWKGTQMALPEKQDWVLLSASHKAYQDLEKKKKKGSYSGLCLQSQPFSGAM